MESVHFDKADKQAGFCAMFILCVHGSARIATRPYKILYSRYGYIYSVSHIYKFFWEKYCTYARTHLSRQVLFLIKKEKDSFVNIHYVFFVYVYK